jgi:hypothetical protein
MADGTVNAPKVEAGVGAAPAWVYRMVAGISFAVALVAYFSYRNVPTEDPTTQIFRTWLEADDMHPAANPIGFHSPFRSGEGVLYVSGRESVPVRAAMKGRLESTHDGRGVALASTDAKGRPLLVIYGHFKLSKEIGEEVECGSPIGSLDLNGSSAARLSVVVKRDHEFLEPPSSLALKQEPL